MLFRRFLSVSRRPSCAPEGWRAYAIGDVHGRLDLLHRLLATVAADHAARGQARGLLVLLGD